MARAFMSISGELHVMVKMSKRELVDAVEVYFSGDTVFHRDDWCKADLRVFEKAVALIRETVAHRSK